MEKNKWSYEELEQFIERISDAMDEARIKRNYTQTFGKLFNDKFRQYVWVNSDMKNFAVHGLDELLRVALGAEMSGHDGWKYPIQEYAIDPVEGICYYEWIMESPWKMPTHEYDEQIHTHDGYITAHDSGYSLQWYGGDMISVEQEDIATATPLQFAHELGLATGQINKTLEDQFYLRRGKERQALEAWKEEIEDIREEYGTE